jgi:hypothetical protein
LGKSIHRSDREISLPRLDEGGCGGERERLAPLRILMDCNQQPASGDSCVAGEEDQKRDEFPTVTTGGGINTKFPT